MGFSTLKERSEERFLGRPRLCNTLEGVSLSGDLQLHVKPW
jgi:hypothetical protein